MRKHIVVVVAAMPFCVAPLFGQVRANGEQQGAIEAAALVYLQHTVKTVPLVARVDPRLIATTMYVPGGGPEKPWPVGRWEPMPRGRNDVQLLQSERAPFQLDDLRRRLGNLAPLDTSACALRSVQCVAQDQPPVVAFGPAYVGQDSAQIFVYHMSWVRVAQVVDPLGRRERLASNLRTIESRVLLTRVGSVWTGVAVDILER